ncbi:hypothetical protein [Helicobacter sp. 23-1045]
MFRLRIIKNNAGDSAIQPTDSAKFCLVCVLIARFCECVRFCQNCVKIAESSANSLILNFNFI